MRGFRYSLIVAALSWCSACGSAADETVEQGDPMTVTLIGQSDLAGVARGCAGRLAEIEAFGVLEERPEFLVALRPDLHSPVCVDTFDAIEAELASRPAAADRLWHGYLTSLQELGSSLGPTRLDEASGALPLD